MIRNSKYWIEKLALQPHPEGGYFREIYRSDETVDDLPERYTGKRNFSTSIYYLLTGDQYSLFHRIVSDEIWHYYQGGPLIIYVLKKDGKLIKRTLGPDPEKGEELQIVIGKNQWFAAECKSGNKFTLAGCTVSPGFDFNDFEQGDRERLLTEYPDHQQLIKRLT